MNVQYHPIQKSSSSVITPRRPGALYHGKYNILAEHIRYQERAVSQVTHQGNFRFASLRHPFAHLRSFFAEYHIDRRFGIQHRDDPVAYLLSHLSVFRYRPEFTMLSNTQSKEFGLTFDIPIESTIRYIEDQFNFIAIAEYFDESLVLLRRMLCWDIRDIIYISLRQRMYKNRYLEPTKEQLAAHKNVSYTDYILYEYFVSKLDQTLRNQGSDFTKELSKFRSLNKAVSNFCSGIINQLFLDPILIYDHGTNDTKVTLDAFPYSDRFSVSALDCAMMKLRTRVHRNILKVRQFPEFCSPSTPRLYPRAIHEDIYWKGPYLVIHPMYCVAQDPETGIPLGVLATFESYMWTEERQVYTTTRSRVSPKKKK